MERDGILVLGIGNLLMGDEGAGVHAVRLLEREPMPGVTVVDGGTGGFHLLEYFERDPIVMIDATLDGRPPGTVTVLEPRFASDFPRTLTAHDIGLRDLVEAATLVGRLPAMYLVTVSIANLQPMEAGLSEAVTAALPRVATTVRSLVEQLRSASARRSRASELPASNPSSR